MKNVDSYTHLRGESVYVDDLVTRRDTLHAAVFCSPVGHGIINHLDFTAALDLEGVVAILSHKDIPGENQIGGIIPDEPLLADKNLHFWGQPIAIVIAKTDYIARTARSHILADIEELEVITTAKEAKQKGSFISAHRTFNLGDVDASFAECTYVFEGNTFTNGQEHLYIETQGAYAEHQENGCLKITSSTQGPTSVQKMTARVLGYPMHKIEVDVTRIGGGFGGKEDQATPWAVMAALSAHVTKRSVKLILDRHDDLKMTGKRHPYESTYKIGLDENLKIKAYQVEFLQNAGAAADLSPAIAERTLFHATNSYYVPNVQATVYSCKTNLPPNTAFRGFGGPQGMFVIEAAIAQAAAELEIPARKIQSANLLQEGDMFPYGQIAKNPEAKSTWNEAINHYNIEGLENKVRAFNAENENYKKGLAMMPIAFGISFTNTPMNHARALVHIYLDGSVGISTAAVEMGQGVNTKLVQVAAKVFSIHPDRIKIESTNTKRVANTSPSAASSTADLNGKALLKACNGLLDRLLQMLAHEHETSISGLQIKNEKLTINGRATTVTWENIVQMAMLKRIALTENAHYATPVIHFDKNKEKGHPFAYHVFGTSIFTVTVDCVRGRYTIDDIKIVHDFGKSMNPGIDMGQVEGALAQGVGWMTMEEIAYNEKGRLLSNALSTYKVPDLFSIADNIEVVPLVTSKDNLAILKSKAVGEPPLMYGIGAYFAIQNAIRAFNPSHVLQFHAPMTPEKVLIALYTQSLHEDVFDIQPTMSRRR